MIITLGTRLREPQNKQRCTTKALLSPKGSGGGGCLREVLIQIICFEKRKNQNVAFPKLLPECNDPSAF